MFKHIFTTILCCLAVCQLNSCYFNTTGYLLDKAQYEAYSTTADLSTQPAPLVYTDGTHYYIELTRYSSSGAAKLQRHVFDQHPENQTASEPEKRGVSMFRIPEDYANWLTGRGRKVDNIAFIAEVPNAEDIKARCTTLPVVKAPGNRTVNFTYHSPNAGWMYLAVPFSWLLVDLPVTIVENSVLAAYVVTLAYIAANEIHHYECPHCGRKYDDRQHCNHQTCSQNQQPCDQPCNQH